MSVLDVQANFRYGTILKKLANVFKVQIWFEENADFAHRMQYTLMMKKLADAMEDMWAMV